MTRVTSNQILKLNFHYYYYYYYYLPCGSMMFASSVTLLRSASMEPSSRKKRIYLYL